MENGNEQLSIMLVDDQSIILDGIAALIEPQPDLHVVARCTTGEHAMAVVKAERPAIALVDINMPGMDGIELTKHIRKASPDTSVVVLSMYGHKEFVLEVMEAGARGYLLKSADKDELLSALRTVGDGGVYVAKELRALVASGDRFKDRRGEDRYGVLSKREVQVVKHILNERTTQEIATSLFISADTVETHRRNIMHKLDVRNTAGLVKYAMERGWDK